MASSEQRRPDVLSNRDRVARHIVQGRLGWYQSTRMRYGDHFVIAAYPTEFVVGTVSKLVRRLHKRPD
jgi:hypothetical protein